jgi:MYXO-CTERM domain-containing protein
MKVRQIIGGGGRAWQDFGELRDGICDAREGKTMTRASLCGLVVAVGLGACGPTYTMTDDVDLTWDFGLTLSRFDDDLHAPYVRGAKVTLFARSSDENPDFRGWTIVSSNPAVFRIDENVVDGDAGALTARGQAMGEGSVELALLDASGEEVGHGVAEVVVPDRVELDAHGSLILGRDDEAPVSEARVLAAGRATYMVRYFRGSRELHGNGVLRVVAPEGVTPQPRTSFLFENREWLTLETTVPMSGALDVYADEVKVATVPVVVVPDTEIVDVVLLTQSERGHEDGDWLVALAQAYDGDGERLFGVEYIWDVDGVSQVGDGDLYRYRFKQGQFQMVQATRGRHSDAVMIQSDEGRVGSTNDIGCTAGGGGSLVVGVVGLALVGVRRRRRAAG